MEHVHMFLDYGNGVMRCPCGEPMPEQPSENQAPAPVQETTWTEQPTTQADTSVQEPTETVEPVVQEPVVESVEVVEPTPPTEVIESPAVDTNTTKNALHDVLAQIEMNVSTVRQMLAEL